MRAEIETVAIEEEPAAKDGDELRRTLLDKFAAFAKNGKKISSEALAAITAIEELDRLSDAIAAHLTGPISERQKLLETASPSARARLLAKRLSRELEIVKVERKVRGRVKDQIERSHREYYLNEQMKAIQKELGEDAGADIEDLKRRVREAGMSEQARRKCEQELKKLGMMSSMSAEASVIRTFVETLLGLPWKKRAKVNRDLQAAQKILDEDHYGLEKVKERILEYLAIQQRVQNAKAPILCLVGPPGVGKTSLGRSIARATNRAFARVALGGVRDEAEIRGHRRTYVGALPGKIMQGMARAGVKNPLFMLDEIDKLGMDFRGDPSSALLEVLDPEQNSAFADHYIEVDYDLSEVMFITTANTLHIPPALADRLEIIRLSGYTEDEKIRIAERHLLPKQFRENGIGEGEAVFRPRALRDIIRYYTREAGVRSLERCISKVCRKLVFGAVIKQKNAAEKPAVAPDKPAEAVVEKSPLPAKGGDKQAPTLAADAKPLVGDGGRALVVDGSSLKKHLGVRQFKFGAAAEEEKIGQVTGLAWTEVGGELLRIEAVKLPGRGKIIRTGKLGEVMRESVEAAMSVVRARSRALGIAENFQKTCDIHVHLPEGAIPKDGPSAGIGVAAAIASVLTGIAVRPDVAMTGEITLGGEVLPIGGLKEKLLAAHRGGIRRVILPEENRRHLEEVPANVRGKFAFHFVRWIDEVFDLALVRPPRPLPAKLRRERASAPPPPPPASAPPSAPH
jgi:ATP-dependent Lon protease